MLINKFKISMSLKQHTVKSYDNDLKAIAMNLEEMVSLVLESVDMASKMIKTRDEELVKKIRPHDYKINSLDVLIEKQVTTILALRQPMAVDLRYIISSLKVSANLERAGDQLKSIIKKVGRFGEDKFPSDIEDSIKDMINLCKSMIVDSVKSFNYQNIDLAQTVLDKDDIIDEIYAGFFKIEQGKTFSSDDVKRITNILFIAKSFERLADYSTNIAEITEFVSTGETN